MLRFILCKDQLIILDLLKHKKWTCKVREAETFTPKAP